MIYLFKTSKKKLIILQKKKNNIYRKVAPPVPDVSPRPPPPLRIGLTSSRTGHSRKTLANNTLINARGL